MTIVAQTQTKRDVTAAEDAQLEPLLEDASDRFTLFPIKHHDLYAMYKTHVAAFWTVGELDLAADMTDWNTKLTDNEKHFIKHVLAFFAASDGIVMENLMSSFAVEVQYAEARQFYAFQNAMEAIHSETYSLLIDTYIANPEEKAKLFDAIQTIPTIKKKAEWATSWFKHSTVGDSSRLGYECDCGKPGSPRDSCPSFARRLVAFACVEGIQFSGSFCAIYWLKKRNLMPGLTFSNELIARDEGLHTDFACLLYTKHIVNRLTDSEVHEIVKGAVDVEIDFICESLPCALIGINAGQMSNYIKFVADRLLYSLGHSKLYGSKNPFPWMEMISLQGKTNFFEKRVSEYQKAGVLSGGSSKDDVFDLNVDF